jgi:riboflavin biosynthesis pyrimidine reductase
VIRRLYPSVGDVTGDAGLEEEYFVGAAPHVRANFVASIDGMVELGGRSSPLGGPADRSAFMAMRAVADVILVGAGTVRKEKYGPVRLDNAVQERRRGRHQAPLPQLAIVSNRGELDPTAKVFSGDSKPLLITSAAAAADRTDLAAVAEMVVCGDQRVDLAMARRELGARGLGRVLCEGGPTLLGSLIGADLLDELCCTTSPWLAGPGHGALLGDQPLPEPVSVRLTAVLEGDGMLLVRYGLRPQP